MRRRIIDRIADPNYVVVSLEFASPQEAQEFLNQPALQKAWDEAGAERPQARVVEEVESATY